MKHGNSIPDQLCRMPSLPFPGWCWPWTFFIFEGSGGVFYSCTKSFLFSLVNPAGIGPTKMTLKSANAANGILCNKDYGPIFGAGHDLMISNASNTKNASQSKLDNTYECPPNQTNTTFLAGNQNFTISEYEIFGWTNHKELPVYVCITRFMVYAVAKLKQGKKLVQTVYCCCTIQNGRSLMCCLFLLKYKTRE